ncbi:MAG TPA: hypothetical protein VMM76_27300 [Pirellulaceae bacterium]|nr:hypothetical protein [Pirellulaceae bacterium]
MTKKNAWRTNPYRYELGFKLRSSDGVLACVACITLLAVATSPRNAAGAEQLWAGAAKVDITNREAGPVNDPLYAKALVIRSAATTAVIVTVDAVALGEIGYIDNAYLGKVRSQVERELKIPPSNVIVNASHCHGVVCKDVDERTFRAIKQASEKMVPVRIGVGQGHEDRVQENRRLKLKSGREADVRHAYSLPPDEEVAEVGPIDPEIGVLRLDRMDGETLAVVYNFACHPIQGVPSRGNTADMTGFASQVIEDNLSDGTIALFVQGCAGDINPISYKDVDHPRDAETLGNLLGLSTLRAARKVKCTEDSRLTVLNEILELPRADVAGRIIALEAEQLRLVQSLRGTSLNLKTFIPLLVKYRVAGEFPSYYSHRYLHDKALGRDDYDQLDAENRGNIERYIQNIHTMELLSRNQTNLALLRKHQIANLAAEKREIDVELVGLRVGDFVLTTFPGELTVRIGLNIKDASPHEHTFVAGYTNGYIYYAPTTEQLRNVGGAQEDSDCVLAPGWQELYEAKVAEMLSEL